MKKMINTTKIQGYLYENKLELKTSGQNSKNPGTEYITGTIDIATDENCTNIVPVHFTYVTATTSKGSANATFSTLKNIIDGNYKSVMVSGKDAAVKLRIDSTLGLNEFYTTNRQTNEDELVSVKRNEGGFVHVTEFFSEDDRNTFACDMVITNVRLQEPDEEKNLPEKAIVKGAIFDFRGGLLPVEFSAINPGAINYFLGLEASAKNPTFTKVWGLQIAETIVRKITEESAFGDDSVREVKSTKKDFLITGAAREEYAWDSEDTITAAELSEAIAARETYLATLKQRRDEYNATKNQPTVVNKPSNGGFDF